MIVVFVLDILGTPNMPEWIWDTPYIWSVTVQIFGSHSVLSNRVNLNVVRNQSKQNDDIFHTSHCRTVYFLGPTEITI